jgi:hypothetical protein
MKKYLPIALALAALAIAGAAPVLAQSVDNRARTYSYSYAPNNSAPTSSPAAQYVPGYGNTGAGSGPSGAW